MVKKPCTVSDCDQPVRARGLCPTHYKRAARRGELGGQICTVDDCERPAEGRSKVCNPHYQKRWRATRVVHERCSIEECDRPLSARGFCRMHYERARVHGQAGGGSPSRAPDGSGYLDQSGYRRFKRNGRVVIEHRDVMERLLGRPLEPFETVHHINGDRADNRPENLQLRTGRHGKGVVHMCGDCGSENIVAAEITVAPSTI